LHGDGLKLELIVWRVDVRRLLFIVSGTALMRNSVRDKEMPSIGDPPSDIRCHRELMLWLLDCLGSMKDAELDNSLMVMYQMWLARNDARESRKIDDPTAIANRAMSLLEEWNNVQCRPAPRSDKPKDRWTPPARDCLKVNVDGAAAKASGNGGGGVVIRDHDGSYIAGACHFFPSLLDPEEAELKACRRGLMLVKELRLNRVQLETDSSGVAAKLNCEEKDRSVHGPLVEEIKKMLQSIEDCSVKWARRSANDAAHKLAREGCVEKVNKTWFIVPPRSPAPVLPLNEVEES
jgi:ribonuclease HI